MSHPAIEKSAYQKELEEAKLSLEREKQKLRSYLEQTPIAMAILRGPAHRYELCNAAYSEFIGHRPVIGKTPQEAFPEARNNFLFELLDQVYKTGTPYQERESPMEFISSVTKKLEKRYRDFAYQPLRGPQGEVEGIIVTTTDVTDRVRSREQLKDNESHFRALADAMPQIVWAADPLGNLTYNNEQAFKYLGSRDPSKWIDFIHEEDREKAGGIWAQSIKTGNPYEAEFRLRRNSDQSYHWHLVRALPILDRYGDVIIWYGTCTDVTAQKDLETELSSAKEQAEAASELKTTFLANMSHEIRTPLGAILGFTELLQATGLTSEQREYIEVITRNGHALTRVIDDILDISKVEAGKLEIETMAFQFEDLVDEVLLLFHEKAKSKGIHIIKKPGQTFPKTVLADPTRLRQILINIVGNAVKFTDTGGVELSVDVQHSQGLLSQICINVHDSGPGLAPTELQRLFQPFMQADSSTNRRFGGTGLGLLLSQKLAQALGGNVYVRSSRVGEGSVFSIEIMAEILPDFKVPTAVVREPISGRQLENIRVLAVDDSLDNRLLLRLFLNKHGANVIEAGDGHEAVHKAAGQVFDVVLMDIQMPGMDGYEAVSILRGQGYTGSIIALTAHAMEEERKRTLASGFDAHITKPIQHETLITTILDQLNRFPS
jgi:PAS domain S-box-containing protein